MDFFPRLGEPGVLDDLFWFGPMGLQIILGFIFFWLVGRRMKHGGIGLRLAATGGLVFAADVLLFIAFGVVFKLANPTL